VVRCEELNISGEFFRAKRECNYETMGRVKAAKPGPNTTSSG
jgi:hypothetical protein